MKKTHVDAKNRMKKDMESKDKMIVDFQDWKSTGKRQPRQANQSLKNQTSRLEPEEPTKHYATSL